MLTSNLRSEELTRESMISGVRAKLDAFDLVEVNTDGLASAKVTLGETVSQQAEGPVFDGVRFKAPQKLKDRDFVWYFNGPTSWGNWFIIPAEGECEGGFKNWMNADCLYQEHDKAGEKERHRILQTLDGSYFESGREYVLWFRRVADDKGKDRALRLVMGFPLRPDGEEWDADTAEKALKLVPAPVPEQVAHLSSRGGQVMLDAALFDPGDASDRIMDVFTQIRHTSRHRGGFFVTMETAIPPCRRTPEMAQIIAKHGPPDLVISGSETRRVFPQKDRGDDDESDKLTLHYYDYFAFETLTDDPKGVVQRVRTHASDFGAFRVPKTGLFARQASLKNLTAFFKDGVEVGRMYFFLEGSKKPVVITEPPAGRYLLDEDMVLQHEASGKWQWLSEQAGVVSRRVLMENHRMNGLAEGFYPGGKPRFKAEYKDGQLHGEVVEFQPDGEVARRTRYVEGRPEPDGDTKK